MPGGRSFVAIELRAWPRLVGLALGALACTSCEDGSDQDRSQPADFTTELSLAMLEDENPDPHILEVQLDARVAEIALSEGLTGSLWTYGGTLPGPLLRVTAGDRVIVHFTNHLPESTTVHWHGVRLEAAMDGAPEHSQPPIRPGESFDYDFIAPDPGLFWYHPHEHDAAQLGFGLYGALLVDPVEPTPEAWGDEVVLVLSDLALDDQGAPRDPTQGGDLATLFGREGDLLLANGKVRPTIHARNGKRQRWRVVNAAKSRYFELRLGPEGSDVATPMTVIGGQTGRYPEGETNGNVLLLPGERVELVVAPRGAPGEVQTLSWVPYDRGYGSTEFREPTAVLDVALEGEALPEEGPIATGAAPVAPLEATSATPVPIRLTMQTDAEGHPILGINDVPFSEAVPIPAEVGETQRWTIDNEMEWDHPFHLHGFFFQTLDESGAPTLPVAWRDTANVPQKGRLELLVRYDNRPGMWMFHCHILDHADAGMMGMVELRRP